MKIVDTRNAFLSGKISKPEFITAMYQTHHSTLFDYAHYLKQTNIASIEITDDAVVLTSRDKGVKMICPLGDYRVAPIEALNFLDYETRDSAMIMQLVSSNDCVIDVGANMGWYSINIAKTYPLCTVHAFEPIPQTYSFLERNLKLNEVKNVTPHHFGLSNECKELTFYFYPEGGVNASSANLSERADAQLISCHVKRLDDFAIDNKLRIDFIKCDVEGAELFVYQGAVDTLQKDKPIVFTEMLRKWASKFNYHPNEILALFASIGYRCFHTDGAKLKELIEMTDETIETNFFFLHSEKHRHYINQFVC